jgi:hypothetical protein
MAQSRYFRPIYPQRPYRPRLGAPTVGGGGGGIGIPNPADLVKQLGAAVQQQRQQALQNQVANQMMNTQVPPRAALVAPGVNPQTGAANVVRPTVMTTGTAPFTGGMDELQARVNAQKLINQLYPNAAIGQARAATALGGGRGPVGPAAGSRSAWARQAGGGGGGWGGGAGRTRAPAGAGGGGASGGGKQAAAVDSNAPQNPAQYNFKTLRANFNDQHGKIGQESAYDAMSPYLNDIKPAGAQNTPQTGLQFNEKGGIDYYKDGKLQSSMMGNDATYWLNRFNTARSNAGLDPIATSLQGKGTMDNPYVLNSPWEYGSVPYNQYFTTTDNPQIGQKLRPEDAPKMAAAQIALGGRGGGGEDYLSSWSDVMGGKTTGPDLPAPTPVAPETGGAGYSASFGAQNAAPPDWPAPPGPAGDQAYTSRFNPPVQPPTPDDQAYTARFNPPPPVASPPMVPVTAESVGVPPSAGSSGAASYYDSVQPGIDPNLLTGGT